MSAYWRHAEAGSRHFCGHRPCLLLDGLATIFLTLAYLAVVFTVAVPEAMPLWGLLGTACVSAGLVLRHWPHPAAGEDPGIEALADATREHKPAPVRALFDPRDHREGDDWPWL